MSSVIEEILTSTVGFVIAMVILAAIIGGGLYGYWVYANHVTLQNYLWPVAEVLPYKGEYFLAIVNTGHEPFYIEQIYLKGGSVITPSQAANPNLNWCSVSNTKLMHNQWWCGEVNQLPVAVRVCSALDPRVCSIVPVHGWQVVTFSQPSQAAFGVGNASCPILAVVNDPYNAGWKVTWSYPIGTTSPVPNPPVSNPSPNYQIYVMSGSSTYGWCINPPYTPIQISFKASITKNPPGLTCQIVPTSVSKTYSAGSVQEFTVICPITVVVNDPYNAGWQISWSGAASGSKSGSSSTKFEVITTSVNGSVAFTASIPSPFSSICSIAPTNATAYPGQTVTFTVSCTRPPYFVYVTVTGDSCGIGWTIYSSVSSISGKGNVKNAMLAIGGYTDWLEVVIWDAPNGQWDFEPGGTKVTNGSSVTFTATCPQSSGGSGNNNYYIYVVVINNSLGAGWQIKSSVSSISGTGNTNSPQQLKIGGQTDTVYASITSNPSGYTCTISPSSDIVSSGATYTFTVSCSNSGGNNPPPPPPPPSNNYFVYVTVKNDSLGAGWKISSSVASISGTGNTNSPQQLKIGGKTDTLTAQITSNPSGYTCTISPGSTPATNGSTYTFTVSCVQLSYPPCTVEPPSVSSSPSGAPTPTSSASVSSIPYGQSKQVTFYYNAQESGNNYKFQYWSIGGQTYYQTNPSITETLSCTTPGGTLTGPSGTAYYKQELPASISINPDTIDLTQKSETYTFTWTSAWSGTGTFTWSVSGTVYIFYGQQPSDPVTWTAKVTLPGNTIAASGKGNLKITNYPTPPNHDRYYTCTVSGGGTINGVSASGGSEQGTVSISCTLNSFR
jgi:hypothetical protein